MKLQVTDILFDFEDDDGILDQDSQEEYIDEVVGNIYDIDMSDFENPADEEIAYELCEEITAQTGWCIKSIDYRHVLDSF